MLIFVVNNRLCHLYLLFVRFSFEWITPVPYLFFFLVWAFSFYEFKGLGSNKKVYHNRQRESWAWKHVACHPKVFYWHTHRQGWTNPKLILALRPVQRTTGGFKFALSILVEQRTGADHLFIHSRFVRICISRAFFAGTSLGLGRAYTIFIVKWLKPVRLF